MMIQIDFTVMTDFVSSLPCGLACSEEEDIASAETSSTPVRVHELDATTRRDRLLLGLGRSVHEEERLEKKNGVHPVRVAVGSSVSFTSSAYLESDCNAHRTQKGPSAAKTRPKVART